MQNWGKPMTSWLESQKPGSVHLCLPTSFPLPASKTQHSKTLPTPPRSSPRFSYFLFQISPACWPWCFLTWVRIPWNIHFVKIHQAVHLWFMHFPYECHSSTMFGFVFFLIGCHCPHIHATEMPSPLLFHYLPGNLILIHQICWNATFSDLLLLQPSNLRLNPLFPFLRLFICPFFTRRHS